MLFGVNNSGGSRNFQKWGPTDCLRGARSSHASVIPYISNKIFSQKGGARASWAPPKSASVLPYSPPPRLIVFDFIQD